MGMNLKIENRRMTTQQLLRRAAELDEELCRRCIADPRYSAALDVYKAVCEELAMRLTCTKLLAMAERSKDENQST